MRKEGEEMIGDEEEEGGGHNNVGKYWNRLWMRESESSKERRERELK